MSAPTNPYHNNGRRMAQPAPPASLSQAPAAPPPPPQVPPTKRAKISSAIKLQMRDLGLADSTGRHTDSALNLLNAFRNHMKLVLAVPTDIEFESDNLRVFMSRMCDWACTRVIPIHFNINLEPTIRTTRCVKETMLGGISAKLFSGSVISCQRTKSSKV
jgi:hypothetical protein